MNLEVLYTPTVQTNDLYNCRVIGVSYPCLFSLRAITTAITGTGSRYIDGALFMEVSAATSSELGVNDLIKLDFAGTLVNSRILSIAEDAASPGTWLIETTYTAGSTPLNTFYLTSPADTVVNFIVNPSGKSEFILESRLDNDGVVNVDVAPALEQHLKTDDSFDYITQVYKEEELTIDFTVKYQILINGVALEAVPLEGVYTAVLAANQNLDSNDSNLIDYVPTGATPSAKFLNSESAKLPAWEGYPFWLDALFSDAVLNPEVSIVGDTVPITLDGKGLYRINGKQSWLAGVHGEICTTTTGTGDGVEPPPLKDVKVLTGYHFRGVAVSKPDLDPVDPVTPASCGQNYLANFKRFRFGYHAVNTIHEGFTLPSGEFIIFGLDASGGEAGFLEAWQFIAKSTPSGWEKVATSFNRGGMNQTIIGTPLEVFDNSTYLHDGFIYMGSVPEGGNNLDNLNTALTAAGKPTIPLGLYASVKQYIYYENTSGSDEVLRLYQIIPTPSIKTEKLGVFAKRICY